MDPASVPTSTISFEELILEVAEFLGLADYGMAGDGEPSVPVDAHDLSLCKRIVNKGIRQFYADAPPTGWNFTSVVRTMQIFGFVDPSSTRLVSGGTFDSAANTTTLTSTEDGFFELMEYGFIELVDLDQKFQIKKYLSPKVIEVFGDASAVSGEQWSVNMDGQYTLPADFHGVYTGVITYAEDTSQGITIDWVNEALIRQWREDIRDETGDPWWAAVRPHEDPVARKARRWQLILYPQPDEILPIIFPYDRYFDKLVDLDDTPPTPYNHDNTVRQSCLAIAERDTEDVSTSHHQQEYQRNLQRSYTLDQRTGPRRLGYFGNPSNFSRGHPIEQFRQSYYDRPDVPFKS